MKNPIVSRAGPYQSMIPEFKGKLTWLYMRIYLSRGGEHGIRQGTASEVG
jgi:hypothetical protein